MITTSNIVLNERLDVSATMIKTTLTVFDHNFLQFKES